MIVKGQKKNEQIRFLVNQYSMCKEKRYKKQRTNNTELSIQFCFNGLTIIIGSLGIVQVRCKQTNQHTIFDVLLINGLLIRLFKSRIKGMVTLICLSLSGLCWANKTGIFIQGTLTILTVYILSSHLHIGQLNEP